MRWGNRREHSSGWAPREPLVTADSDDEAVVSTQVLVTAAARVGEDEDSRSGSAHRGTGLLAWAVGASLSIHFVLLLMLFVLEPDSGRPNGSSAVDSDEQQTIVVRMVGQNPLRATAEEPAQVQESEGPEVEKASEAIEPEVVGTNNELVVAEPIDELLEPGEESSILEVSDAAPEPTQEESGAAVRRPGVIAPTVAMMRDSIQAMDSQMRTQSWRRQCSPLQEESELLDCAEVAESDYSAATDNAVYRALNPAYTQSRSQRSVPVIAGEYAGLVEQIDTLVERRDLPAWLGDYALQQVDRSISDESGNVNRVVDHMIQMTDKSEAAQRGRIMFGDAWLRNTIEEAVRRDAHIERGNLVAK